MNNTIGVVNYGVAGNIHSIKKAIEKAGGIVKIINHKQDFKEVSKIVIPGVGSFKDAMLELENDDLLEQLQEEIKNKITLGICLGMQILSNVGFEYGETKGLSAIKAKTKLMPSNLKVPHMGFSDIKITKTNKLFTNIENEEFYFMHSYEMKVEDVTTISSKTNYFGYEFISSIQKDNVYGVQFHPEKSREAGIELFKNFINNE